MVAFKGLPYAHSGSFKAGFCLKYECHKLANSTPNKQIFCCLTPHNDFNFYSELIIIMKSES